MKRRLAVGSIALAMALSFSILWSSSPNADADWVMGDIACVAIALGLQPSYDGKYDLSEILCEVLIRLGVECQEECFIAFNNTVDVFRGNAACLHVSTLPGAICSIQVILPSGTVSDGYATGLSIQTANASGDVIWSWLVGGNTGSGTGTIRVVATAPDGEICTAEMEWIVRQK